MRDLARRQLDVLLASWAQEQVGGYPGGAEEPHLRRLGAQPAEQPLAGLGLAGRPGSAIRGEINFMDRPELPVSRYQIPEGVVRLLTDRRKQAPYEIRARRKIAPVQAPRL